MEKNRPVTIVIGGLTAVGIVAGFFISASVMPGQSLMITLITLAVILAGLAMIVAVNFLVFVPLVWLIAKLGGTGTKAEDARGGSGYDAGQHLSDSERVANEGSSGVLKTSPLRHHTASVAMLVLDVAGLLWLTFCTTFGVARFHRIFDDLMEGRGLPAMTNFFLSVPRFAYVVLFVGLIATLLYKELHVANKTRTLIVNIAVLVASALFCMAFVVAMVTPMFSIIGTIVE